VVKKTLKKTDLLQLNPENAHCHGSNVAKLTMTIFFTFLNGGLLIIIVLILKYEKNKETHII